VTQGSGDLEETELVSDTAVWWRCPRNVASFVQVSIPDFVPCLCKLDTTDTESHKALLESGRKENCVYPPISKPVLARGLRVHSSVQPAVSKPMGLVKFEVFTAVIMKNGVFLDVMPCGSCKNRRFGGT
jgi:hypothetical protein